MAKPITTTTPLEGRDAEEFLKSAQENERREPSQEESKQIKDSLDRAFRRFEGMKIVFQ